jgi:prepilin-type N-terminal cleavage/methylation domain-containing protein
MEESVRKRNSGFTLIELLTVVAIIGVLATLALSNFSLFKGNAINATAASDARTLVPAADAASTNESSPFGTYTLTGVGGTDGLGVLASQFGGRYSPSTLGTVEVNANHYRIRTYQVAGDSCYTVDDGVMTASPGVCS